VGENPPDLRNGTEAVIFDEADRNRVPKNEFDGENSELWVNVSVSFPRNVRVCEKSVESENGADVRHVREPEKSEDSENCSDSRNTPDRLKPTDGSNESDGRSGFEFVRTDGTKLSES
jgi:hypothetical protein